MSEETEQEIPDRYVIESAGRMLKIKDLTAEGVVLVETYPVENWSTAWLRLAVLNQRAAAGMANPASEPLVPGVTSAKALAGFARGAEALRATQNPREFLTQTLPAKAAEQRSETLSRLLVEAWDVVDQSLSLLKQDAEILSRATAVVAKLERELAALNAGPPRMAMEGPALSRPQPY